jgi:hypothetical protein
VHSGAERFHRGYFGDDARPDGVGVSSSSPPAEQDVALGIAQRRRREQHAVQQLGHREQEIEPRITFGVEVRLKKGCRARSAGWTAA